MLQANPLATLPGVRHGFFTRKGGVSQGLFASLNCGLGSGDDTAAVAENRRRVAGELGTAPERLLTLYQVHSPTVVEARDPWTAETRPHADAQVTRERGLAIGVLSADCAPILLADAEAGVIGAAHAGWKGAVTGVVAAVVAAMEGLGAARKQIRAAVGPCIGQASYEVGPEFPRRFLEAAAENAAFFRPGVGDRQLFDLKGYVERQLERAGVGEIAVDPADTADDETRFFSYRRATQRGERDYGRLVSAILLEA